jgi:hypothetical protein
MKKLLLKTFAVMLIISMSIAYFMPISNAAWIPFKDDDGNFSETKFHEFYTDALKNYNVLAAGWQPTFHENNIFAPAKQRRTEPAFMETTV